MKLKHLFLGLCCLPLAAFANEPNKPFIDKNEIRFSVESQREIQQDLMQVVMSIQDEDKDLKALNQRVTKKLNDALAIAKQQANVEVETRSRHAQQRYDNKTRKPTVWVDQGEIVLKSRDFAALSALMGQLGDTLTIDSIQSSLSPEALKQVEDEMLTEALAKFKQKAKLIQRNLNAKSYQVGDLSISNAGEDTPYARMYPSVALADKVTLSSSNDNEGMALQSGKSTVRVRIDAQIRLSD